MRVAALALCLFSFPALAQDSGLKLSYVDEPARLLQQGQQVTLRATLTDGGGNPVAGAAVTFQAPAGNRPTGVFYAKGVDAASQYTATTGDDGVASVLFEAGTVLGPYFVEVRAEGAARPLEIGISNVVNGAPAPVLSASAMRRAIESKAGGEAIVYGPVWVPAFTAITAGGPPSIYSSSNTYTPQISGTWIAWIDLAPGQLFGHPTQWVISDASRNDFLLTAARYSRENWWPNVRLSGGQLIPLLPISNSGPTQQPLPLEPDPCSIVLFAPGAPGGAANAARIAALWNQSPYPANRTSLAGGVQGAVDAGCGTVNLWITANGFAPRIPRTDFTGGSLGGLVLADDNGAPTDFVDFGDIARALLPLKSAALNIAIEASYAGNAVAALSGQGLSGTLLTGADDSSVQNAGADGTPLNLEFANSAQADTSKSFARLAADVVANASPQSAASHPRAVPISAAGPKALALPNFSFPSPGLFDRGTIALPADFPQGVTPTLQVTVADPRIADIDPRTASGTLPQFTVLAGSTGSTTYRVQISGTDGAPLYTGTGKIVVGQEITCTPSVITLRELDRGEIRVSPGSLYNPIYNGAKFTAVPLNESVLRLTNTDVDFSAPGTSDVIRFLALTKGTSSIQVSGTRAFGSSYTACIVDVNVIPPNGEGTSNTSFTVSKTDSSLAKLTPVFTDRSASLAGVATVGADELLCTASSTPLYTTVAPSPQAFQRTVNGQVDAQALCFYPPAGGTGTATVQWSGLLGGKGTDLTADVVADGQGNLWIVGTTDSTDLPVSAGGRKYAGKGDLFIGKVSRFGEKLLFSTYIGGTDQDIATGAAVDAAGNLYVTGYTASVDLPVTTNAVQRNTGGGTDGFLLKFDSAGVLRYSTYFGGQGQDIAWGVAVDPKGSAYITGQTSSADLKVTPGALRTQQAQGPSCPQAGGVVPCPDAFVARYSENLTSLVYATFLGGTNFDYARSIAVDAAGNAIVAGGTYSPDFPTTSGVYQPARRSAALCFGGLTPCPDAFVSIVNPGGTALVASTYLGGDGYDEAQKVAADAAGNVWVLGTTISPNFPVTSAAFQKSFGGGDSDAFLTALGPGLRALVGSSYLGTANSDAPATLTIGRNGAVYVGVNTTVKVPGLN